MLHIHHDPVKLTQRQRRDEQPGLAPVVRNPNSAVVPFYHMARIGRIDPQNAVVAVQGLGGRPERNTAVVRIAVAVHHVDALVVAGIHKRLAGVHGTRVPITHVRPCFSFVFRAIQTCAAFTVGGRGVILKTLFE